MCQIFSCDPIPGNVDLQARDFHGESYYDIPTLTADQRFRDFNAVDPTIFIAAIHDSEAVFLSTGGA